MPFSDSQAQPSDKKRLVDQRDRPVDSPLGYIQLPHASLSAHTELNPLDFGPLYRPLTSRPTQIMVCL